MLRQSGLSGPFFQNTGTGCAKTLGNYLAPGKPGSGPPVDPTLVFHGIAEGSGGRIQGVRVGVGDAVDNALTNVWHPDHTGLYKEFAPAEVAYRNARVEGNVGSRQVYVESGADWKAMGGPQVTNILPWSRDTDQWSTPGIQTRVHDGVDGDALAAVTLETVNGSYNDVFGFRAISFGAAINILAVCWVRKVAFPAVYPAIYVYSDGSAGVDKLAARYVVDPENGTLTPTTTLPNEGRGAIFDDGGWWRVVLEGRAPADATFAYIRAYPGYNTTGSGVASTAAAGFSTFDCFMLLADGTLENRSQTPLIVTNGSEKTVAQRDVVFDAGNLDDTEGTWYLEADLVTSQEILSAFLVRSAGNVILTDGTNQQTLAKAEDFLVKIGFVYGSGTMRLNVDGVWHAEGPYDGALPDGVLDLFSTTKGAVGARNLRRYSVKDETIINDLMA